MRRSSYARALTATLLAPALLAAAGCRGSPDQSVLEAAGPQAGRVERLWWFSFYTAAAIYVVTVGALLWAGWRARRRDRAGGELPPEEHRGMWGAVAGGVAVTVAILTAFFFYDLSVGSAMSGSPTDRPLTIEVVGHQWWWEVTYADTSPHGRFSTANEIHVPVGRPVLFKLTSQDVIHSLWVPNLAGKKDLTPGYTQTLWFQADTPGVYRGQCTEFCGHQHAKMGLLVIAEPPDQYAAWAKRSQQPAPEPTDSVTRRGQQVFLTHSCVMCHAIEGTSAGSRAGPPLTGLAGRLTIAAGTLPNTRGNLAGWIVDPQRVKPGTHMPPNALESKDLDALLTYLQSLK
jgi:cytochrome c oxidase subunit 2